MVLAANIELDPIPEHIVPVPTVVHLVPPVENDPEDGSEEDAEGEEDWGTHQTDSDRDPANDSANHQPQPVPTEEEPSISSTSSSDDDFLEDLTSEEDDEVDDDNDDVDDDDDDDDDEFVLNPRQRPRRATSTVDTRRRTTASANAATSARSSDSFMAYSITEGRSLRSRSLYPDYSDYFPEHDAAPFDMSDRKSSAASASASASPSSSTMTTPGRRRTRPSPSLGVPVPVPNLTKKSRGRRVPTMSSLEDLRSAASGAGRKRQSAGGKHARMYLCDVEGCGKCFARGEHLKRHVRSIHTYEKRMGFSFFCGLVSFADSFGPL